MGWFIPLDVQVKGYILEAGRLTRDTEKKGTTLR